jgi:hypothetical protein
VVCHFGLRHPKWGKPSMRMFFLLHSNSSAMLIPVMVSHRLMGMLLSLSGTVAFAKSYPSLNWALATVNVIFGNSSKSGNLFLMSGGKWSDMCQIVLKNSAPSGEHTHGSSVSFFFSYSELGLLLSFNAFMTSVRVFNSFP